MHTQNVKTAAPESSERWGGNPLSADTQTPRDHVMLIVAMLDTGMGFHFVSHPTLSGSNSNLWFPMPDGLELLAAVEQVMVMNHAANNVVRLELFHEGDGHADYRVVFNREIRVC